MTDNPLARITHSADPDADLAIAASTEAASRALRAGSSAPSFKLQDASGRDVMSDDLLRRGPIVLHFLRGSWCTLSDRSLTMFASSVKEIVSMGATALAASPMPLDECARQAILPAQMLYDREMLVARQFGLAFQLPERLRSRYSALGYQPPRDRQDKNWLVPIPATYLIDRSSIIAMALVDVDYRNPFDPALVLTALRAIAGSHAKRSAIDKQSF